MFLVDVFACMTVYVCVLNCMSCCHYGVIKHNNQQSHSFRPQAAENMPVIVEFLGDPRKRKPLATINRSSISVPTLVSLDPALQVTTRSLFRTLSPTQLLRTNTPIQVFGLTWDFFYNRAITNHPAES